MLTETIRFRVPFYDMDALRVVWHGNYVKYLERGREAFGDKYGLEYMWFYDHGYTVPVVDMHLRYHASAHSGEMLRLETTFVPKAAAKLVFSYRLFRESDNVLLLTAETTQLFVSKEGEFMPANPPFFSDWKKKMKNSYFFFASEPEMHDDHHTLKVELNPDCEVYKGHFPGNPISPGVCSMKMIQTCAEKISGRKLLIEQIGHCRFLSLITPKDNHFLFVNIKMENNDDKLQVSATITDENEKVYVDFKGIMK